MKETQTMFNLQHNLSEYNKLVLENYPDELTAVETAPAPRINIELEQYAVHKPSKPTYRPTLIETGFDSTEKLDHSDFFKRDIYEEAKTETKIKAEIDTESNFQTVFKLNGVGMVAVVSFIAVTLLIIAFVIANSVAISNSAARIESLRSANYAIHADVLSQQAQNNQTYDQRAQEARDQVFAPGSGYVPVTPQQLPPSSPWTPAANPDASTNWFNQISRFFSRLFT